MTKLWYKKSAKQWKQALPLGNGITGVMVYGGKKYEKLTFNDCTLWSGYPKDQDNPKSLENLNEVRKLVFEEKNKEADRLAESKLIGHYSESFMPLGVVKLTFGGNNIKNYKRELDLSTAIHTVSGKGVTREAFVSYPDKVAVYHIKAEKPFNLSVNATSKLHSDVIFDGSLNLTGNAPDYAAPNYLRMEKNPIRYGEKKGMCFCLRIEFQSNGSVSPSGKNIKIDGATDVTLYMTTATGYVNSFEMPKTDRSFAIRKCKDTLKVLDKNYKAIKEKHIADYSKLFKKHSFSLADDCGEPTDELLKKAKDGDVKNALIELHYNYGKYLTIAGSRKGGQALNLQGLWNNSIRPPWSSNYTANINAEMNYWGASAVNLSECMEPYVNLVYEIMQKGKKTARVNYGCGGFACNHNVDIWRKTAPVQGDSNYMYAPMCGVWLANELYEHYKNGKLCEFKDKIYEIVRSAAEFTVDYLVLHDGYYMTAPSASPENSFLNTAGDKCSLDYASAFELGLTRQIFENLFEIDSSGKLVETAKEKLSKLYPFTEGATGINEWHKDYVAPEKGHRHFSPLYAFYPGRVIGYHGDAMQRESVRKLFHFRLDNCKSFVGWSAAWAVCLAARLHDNASAKKVINDILKKSVYRNLFNAHPPSLFQIDGNFGFVAGVNEMLVYMENNIVELLPALPLEWQNGAVKGMVIRGAVIDFAWKNGKIVSLTSDKTITVLNTNLASELIIGENITLINAVYN